MNRGERPAAMAEGELDVGAGRDVPEYATADLYRRKDRAGEADMKLMAMLSCRQRTPDGGSVRTMSEAEVAQMLGMTADRLARKRRDATGPKPHGRRHGDRGPARYAYQEVHDWGVKTGKLKPA